MYAAIDVLVSFSGQEKNSIAVLGDMAELGSDAAAMHFNVGQYAALAGVDCIYVVGEFAAQTLAGFNQQNDSETLASSLLAQSFSSQDALITQLLSSECESSVVLVKGSRSAAMDYVVSALDVSSDAINLAITGAK
jgi:UDP-N-acetylmuramoyl-tripeptide--D-alanyl-D-alanine ligase